MRGEYVSAHTRVFSMLLTQGLSMFRCHDLMLVIHPTDNTTAMLGTLYEGVPGVKLLTQRANSAEVSSCLNHLPCHERIMLLGHGSDKGLYSRVDDTKPVFDRIIVGHRHAYYLRRHGGNIMAVWCNADLFGRANGLHGLFSGMIVTEMSEAVEYGIATTVDELATENVKLARRLRFLLDAATPLIDIPSLLLAMDDAHTPLTTFNYGNFHYL